MVATGEWRDYGISSLREFAVFSVFKRTSENPIYRIETRPKLFMKQSQYLVLGIDGQILKRGNDLKMLLRFFDKKLISNTWKFIFNPNEENASASIGLFNSIGQNEIGATFRTTTGDYGYMQGGYKNGNIVLSTFNGARAYLLEAKLSNDSIKGVLYAGNHSKTIIEGVLDNDFELADEYTLIEVLSIV